MEADGFQADTEDDDELDCVLISVESGELERVVKEVRLPLFASLYTKTVLSDKQEYLLEAIYAKPVVSLKPH